MADVVGQVPGQFPTFTSGHNPQAGVPGGGTVTSLSAISPLRANPDPITGTGNFDFPSWPADAVGDLHNDGAGVLSWESGTGNFVRLLADPTIDSDAGGFHVTGTGIMGNTLIGTVLNPGNDLLRVHGATTAREVIDYQNGADGNYAALALGGPGATSFLAYLDNGASGSVVNIGWNGPYVLPSHTLLSSNPGGPGMVLFDINGGSGAYTASYNIFSSDPAFGTALTLSTDNGSGTLGTVSIMADASQALGDIDFKVFLGAATPLTLGTERLRIYNSPTTIESPAFNDGQFLFGNVAGAVAAMSTAADGQFIFIADPGMHAIIDVCDNPGDSGVSQFSLHAVNALGGGDGFKMVCRAHPGETEDGSFIVGGVERVLLPADNFARSSRFIIQANPNPEIGANSDTASLLFQATDSNSNLSTVSWGIELPGDGVNPGDLVGRTGAGEQIRANGAAIGVRIGGALSTTYALTLPETFALGWDNGGVGSGTSGGYIKGGGSFDDNTGFLDFLGQWKIDSAGTQAMYPGSGQDLGTTNPLLGTRVGTGYFQQIDASSLSGISALFQTSATDGSNANATVVVRANTGQNAPLFQLQDSANANLLSVDALASALRFGAGVGIVVGVDAGGVINGAGGNFEADVNDGVNLTGAYFLQGSNGNHFWGYTKVAPNDKSMSLDANGLTVPDNVDAASYSSAGGAQYVLPAVASPGVLTCDAFGVLTWV